MNESQKRDAAYMASEDDWPRWPLLPVVKRLPNSGWSDIGLMFAGRGPKVFVGLNLWSYESQKTPERVDTYATFEECAREWRVD